VAPLPFATPSLSPPKSKLLSWPAWSPEAVHVGERIWLAIMAEMRHEHLTPRYPSPTAILDMVHPPDGP
jgi:hypothetical protein